MTMTHPMFWMSEEFTRQDYDEACAEYEIANICRDVADELRAAGFFHLAAEVEHSQSCECAMDVADFISGHLAA